MTEVAFTCGIGFAAPVTLTAAATVDLSAVDGNQVAISGTATISSFGIGANLFRIVNYLSAAPLVNSAALNLALGRNRTTSPGDYCIYVSDASGNWHEVAAPQQTPASPTVQRFLSGSGTYTPTSPAVKWIRVRKCGGGGGGGGTSSDGGTGSTTSFGGWTTVGGSGGSQESVIPGNPGGAGGSGGTNGIGTLIDRISGGGGGPGVGNSANAGGDGGTNPFGGAGKGGVNAAAAGAGAPNSGAGGGGTGTTATSGAGGGGAGEFVEFTMTAAQIGAGQTYSVGVAGAAGSGTSGGNGAAGKIIVEEFYS